MTTIAAKPTAADIAEPVRLAVGDRHPGGATLNAIAEDIHLFDG